MAAEVKRLFEGSWASYKVENLEAFMDKMRIPAATREGILKNGSTLEIKVEGQNIIISGKAGSQNFRDSIKLGQDFKDEAGRLEKGNMVFSNGVLTSVLTPADPTRPRYTITRKIVDGDIVQTTTADDAVTTRYFKRT